MQVQVEIGFEELQVQISYKDTSAIDKLLYLQMLKNTRYE